jgi:hypothetical protein
MYMYVYVCILISTQAAKLKQGRGVHTHGGILLRVWPAAYIPVTDIFVISGTCACHKAQSCNKQNSLSQWIHPIHPTEQNMFSLEK